MVKGHVAWIGAAAVTVVVAILQVNALVDRSRGEPANGGIRRYVLGEIRDGVRVEQQFLVKANGLSAVTIHPRATPPGARGTATVEVRDVTHIGNGSDAAVIAREIKPLNELVRAGALTVTFAPQPSWYRTYRVVVAVDDADYGMGFGLLAARGDGHRDFSLIVNDTQKWGDLIFETTVTGATSNFEIVSRRFRSAGFPAPGIAFGLLLAIQYAALFVVVRSLWERADGP